MLAQATVTTTPLDIQERSQHVACNLEYLLCEGTREVSLMPFPILSLPLEVRRPIYRYALPHSVDVYSSELANRPEVIEFDGSPFEAPSQARLMYTCPVRWWKGICPSILFANRQIYEEACEVLYHENTFIIYVRHPRQPRLPFNESRADDDSFALISWSHRNWSHPRNHKIPLTVLHNHKHLSQIRRLHIELPGMRDLFAADMYMRTTTHASHHGLDAWIEKLRANGGKLSDEDNERMNYINQIKAPIDEIAGLVRTLPHVDNLVIFFESESYEVVFIEYVISSLLHLRGIKRARCSYKWSKPKAQHLRRSYTAIKLRNHMMAPRMHDLERALESLLAPEPDLQVTSLSAEAVGMLRMLTALRNRMLLIRELRSKYEDSRVDAVLPFLTNIMRE